MLSRKVITVYLVIAAFSLLTAISTTATDNQTFDPTSYLPERFEDFQLFVSGDLGLRNQDTENRYDRGDPPTRSGRDSSELEGNSRDIRLRSLATYRLQSIQQFLEASFRLTSTTNKSSSSRVEEGQSAFFSSDPRNDTHERSESDRTTSNVGLTLDADYGHYIWKDVHLAATASIDYNYRENNGQYDVYVDGPIYSAPDIVGRREETSFGEESTVGNDRGVSLELKGGVGRMYTAGYAITALDMIDELRKGGLLLREPTYPEMVELTRQVHVYRTTLYVDSRYHRIDALNSLMGYLEEKQIIDDAGSYGYLIIQDVWDYFPSITRSTRLGRQFGWRGQAGYGLEVGQGSNSYSVDGTETAKTYEVSSDLLDTTLISEDESPLVASNHASYQATSPYLSVSLLWAKPTSARWQFGASASARKYLDWDSRNSVNETSFLSQYRSHYRIGASASAEYFYDRRTSIRVETGFSRESRKLKRSERSGGVTVTEFPENKLTQWNYFLDGNLTYRISVPTTVTLNLRYDKRHTENSFPRLVTEQASEYSMLNIRASIGHYLF